MYHMEHFKVILKVAADWKKVAGLLGLPTEVVDIIQHDTANFGCERSCRETFRRWLGEKGCQPITWERLIEVLKDAERSELAKELENHLQGKVSIYSGCCTQLLINCFVAQEH